MHKLRRSRERAECMGAFPDHEQIHSLGYESAVNVPVRWDGQTIASLNCCTRQAGIARTCCPN